MLKEFREEVKPTDLDFEKTPIWLRLYDVPLKGRNPKTIKAIACRFGEVIEIDESTLNGISRSVRIKILINLTNPIKKGTKIQIGNNNPCWIPAAYERIPTFCYWCGRIGHNIGECSDLPEEEEDADIKQKEMPYGEWMRASPLKPKYITPFRKEEVDQRTRRTLLRNENSKERQEEKKGANYRAKKQNETATQVMQLTENLEKFKVNSEGPK